MQLEQCYFCLQQKLRVCMCYSVGPVQSYVIVSNKIFSLDLRVKSFLKLVTTEAVLARKEFNESMTFRVLGRKSGLKMSSIPTSVNLELCELGTQQNRQLSRSSLPFYIYALKDPQVRRHLFYFNCEQDVYITLLSGTRVLQLMVDNSQGKALVPYETSVPISFEAQLYYHSMTLMSNEIREKS